MTSVPLNAHAGSCALQPDCREGDRGDVRQQQPGRSLMRAYACARAHALAQPQAQLLPVDAEVDRLLGYTAINSRLCYGHGLPQQDARIKRFRDQVVRTKLQMLDSVGLAYRIGHLFLCKGCQGAGGGKLHLFIDLGRAHVQGTAENRWESEYVVYLVWTIRAASRDDDISAA